MSEQLITLVKSGGLEKDFPFSQAERILQIDQKLVKKGGSSVWQLADKKYIFDGSKLTKKKRARTSKNHTESNSINTDN
jgi:hypothetical protein